MFQALDPKTELWIHASSPNARKWGLICPCCRQPVIKRAGAYRATHYAHLSGRADPNCENYVSQYGGVGTWRPSPTATPPPDPDGDRAQGIPELYLGVRPDLTAALFLCVPRYSGKSLWTGRVGIAGARGITSFGAEALRKDRFVQVEAGRPSYEIVTEGDVLADYVDCLLTTPGLRRGVTVFRASERMGRRVNPSESIYWEEPLWIVMPTDPNWIQLFSEDLAASLQYSQFKFDSGWMALELQLPPIERLALPFFAEEYRKVLGVRIAERHTRLLVHDPMPHHFTEEGEFAIPLEGKAVQVFRSEPIPIWVEEIEGVHELHSDELSDDMVEFTGIGEGLLRISAYQSQSIEVRVGECAYRFSRHVCLRSNSISCSIWQVLSEESLRHTLRSEGASVTLEVPHPVWWQITFVNNKPWAGDDAFRELLQTENDVTLEISGVARIVFSAQSEVTQSVPTRLYKGKEDPILRRLARQAFAVYGRRGYRAAASKELAGLNTIGHRLSRFYAPQLRARLKKQGGGR